MTQKTELGSALAVRDVEAALPASGRGVIPWDPFALMDKLDAEAFVQEMSGIASDVLVYTIKDGGKETTGLSKAGVDECCTMLVTTGQCIREESIVHEMIGVGEQQEAIFKCVAARYAVKPDGTEVRLDQVIGVKREPLYEDRAPLTLTSRVPGKRWKTAGAGGAHLTYGEALDDEDARGYLEWIADESNFDEATKTFVRAILNGVDVREFSAGKRFNPFWYEHGAMKAARNARFRLIPAGVKAQVLALGKKEGRERQVERASESTDPAAATKRAEQPRFTKDKDGVIRGDFKGAHWDGTSDARFPYPPYKDVPLNAKYAVGARREKGKKKVMTDVGGEFVISNETLLQCDEWARKLIAEQQASAAPDDDKLALLSTIIEDVETEGKARAAAATPAGGESGTPAK